MIHDFDWLRWTFGPVNRVHARHATARGELTSYALAVLRHESGVISHVEGYWGHELAFRTKVELAGDRGAIEYDSGDVPLAIHRSDGQVSRAPVVLPESPLEESPYLLQDRSFIDCVRRRTPPDPAPEDALEALRIALACVTSARTGNVACL